MIIGGIIGVNKLYENGYEIVLFSDSHTNETETVPTLPKEKDYTKMTKEELEKEFLIQIEKYNDTNFDKIIKMNILNPNDTLDDGETLYSKTVAAALKHLEKSSCCTDYFYAFDTLRKTADISKINIPKREDLSQNQINFLQCVGIDLRSDEEKQADFEKEQKEFKEKEKERANKNPVINGFEFYDLKGKGDITGKIKNTNNVTYKSVFVNINILNKKGEVISSTIDTIQNLQPNQVWNFKAHSTVQEEGTFQIMDIKGYN